MIYDPEKVYLDQYNNDDNNNLSINDYDIDMTTGWSFICLNETISYYTDCNNKNNDFKD
uniref:Uncharacterized protein n=1 Tax=Dasyclonium flaccidum TaxID=2007274 RepID=A0A1Z1ML71_9FLOR|nr:hypothetical protein [Dasyclonium flaccidum]ARW66602.1 hypothetical protein [Dasyclonium flaccidum]